MEKSTFTAVDAKYNVRSLPSESFRTKLWMCFWLPAVAWASERRDGLAVPDDATVDGI